MENKIVILGGGQVSAYASKTIREHNKKVQIQIITEENHNPYERPPLSKDCLLNKTNYDECSFFNKDFYIKNEIEILKNKKIVKTDFKKNILIDENNNSFQYNKLLIATGSINRILKIDGHIVTNDKLRDHHFEILQNLKSVKLKKSPFLIWTNNYVLNYEIKGSKIQIAAQKKYTNKINIFKDCFIYPNKDNQWFIMSIF